MRDFYHFLHPIVVVAVVVVDVVVVDVVVVAVDVVVARLADHFVQLGSEQKLI